MSSATPQPIKSALQLFVACAPGLEALLADEVRVLGFTPSAVAGGVECETDLAGAYRLLLGTGLSQRVLLRLGSFRAVRFPQLQRELRALPFASWLPAGCKIRLKATSRKSRLYHSGAVAERCAGVLADLVQAEVVSATDAGTTLPVQVHLRLADDLCTVSLDLTGSPQHERGHRLNPGKAPLREDLARALLICAGFNGKEAVVDPCCGVGTLPLEAALLASGLPPGGQRRFTLQSLRTADTELEAQQRAALTPQVPRARPTILGNDRDAAAIRSAKRNSERSPFHADVAFQQGSVSALTLPELTAPEGEQTRGLIIANPPYGQRLGNKQRLRDLYAALGQLRRRAPEGYRLSLVTSEPNLAAAVDLPLESRLMTDLGGTKVRFYIEVV